MERPFDRRQFLKMAGTSPGVGALYRAAPALARESASAVAQRLAEKNGERLAPFSFVQMSDPHVGFDGPPNPDGTHRGVHFVALDNVSRARPEVGSERIAWLRRDLARFSRSTPIVILTHRPLFDLKPGKIVFTPSAAGRFTTICHHLCGPATAT